MGAEARGPAPVRTFGVPPRAALPAIALVFVALAVVMLALGQWAAGVLLLVTGGVIAAMSVGAIDGRGSGRKLAAFRSRGRAAVESMSAQAQARRQLLALRLELERLLGERSARLRELGEAVYADDAAGTEATRAAVRELDDRIVAKEEQMTHVTLEAQERVQQVRAESRPTVLLEPPPPAPPEPYPPAIPEPYPPPDEGTPPTPAPVPEPYPPPDEGSPPRTP